MRSSSADLLSRTVAQSAADRGDRPATIPEKTNVLGFLVSGILVLPYSAAIYLGDVKLTPIKILMVALFLPAVFKLISSSASGERRLVASDAYALAVFVLMAVAPLVLSGTGVFVSAFSQALEFYGMYVVGRAYFFSTASINDLAHGLQIATVMVVFLGAVDILTQRYFTQDLVNSLFPASWGRALEESEPSLHRIVLGIGSLRATSTFDHPILFGTFCATVLPLHLYAPMSRTRRMALIACCIAGGLMALSSAPLLAISVVFVATLYDRFMKACVWRWKLLLYCLAACVIAFSLGSDNPMSWLFRNLTLDPQTAYFRLLIWDAALSVIGANPWLGLGFNPSGNRILDSSTDSLLLAKAITYGVPMVGSLYLAALSTTIPIRGEREIRKKDTLLDVMCTSFSLSLAITIFVSMTVTFWNAVWLFFALCVGVRASLKEQCLSCAMSRFSSDPANDSQSADLVRYPYVPLEQLTADNRRQFRLRQGLSAR